MAWRSAASTTGPRPTAAEQAEPAVSIASRAGPAPLSDVTEIPGRVSPGRGGLLDRADFAHFRDVMPQHVLDAGLQRRGRAWTSRARTLHVQINDPILKIMEDDVAAIHRDRGTHPGFKQFLDLRHDLVVFLAAFRRIRIRARLGEDDRPPGRKT